MARLLIIIASLVGSLIGALFIERLIVAQRLGRLKVRIAVTGTRGKSSVTRLVAAALRQSGRRVLAKTTGSAAMAILPDGSEVELPRPGPATILEHKSVLRLARRSGADALVAEMMSIRPECLRVESWKLLRPQVLVITNVRVDHREEQGTTRPAVAQALAEAISPGCTVLVPAEDDFPVFAERTSRVGARIIRLPEHGMKPSARGRSLPATEFEANIRMALAAVDVLGMRRSVALAGMARAKPDPGGLTVLRARLGSPPKPWFLISAFAANEPESTRLAMEKLRGLVPLSRGRLRAVLNLRDDRGDRTRQWLSAMRNGFFRDFEGVTLVGSSAAAALRRSLRRIVRESVPLSAHLSVLTERSPEAITEHLASVPGSGPGGTIIGLGNMGGLGLELKAYWERIGGPWEKGRA